MFAVVHVAYDDGGNRCVVMGGCPLGGNRMELLVS